MTAIFHPFPDGTIDPCVFAGHDVPHFQPVRYFGPRGQERETARLKQNGLVGCGAIFVPLRRQSPGRSRRGPPAHKQLLVVAGVTNEGCQCANCSEVQSHPSATTRHLQRGRRTTTAQLPRCMPIQKSRSGASRSSTRPPGKKNARSRCRNRTAGTYSRRESSSGGTIESEIDRDAIVRAAGLTLRN
jgi:hypothetical protein